MGAPAIDPAAGCLPAIDSPGLFSQGFALVSAGAFALAAQLLLPSPSLRSFLADQDLSSCNDFVGAPKGRLPLSPVGTGDCKDHVFALLFSVDGGGCGGWAAAGCSCRYCQDLLWRSRYFPHKRRLSVTAPFCVAHPSFFFYKTSHPTTWSGSAIV